VEQLEAISSSEAETEALGERLSEELCASDVVYLIGDLGAGKTCLARGIARGLGASGREVASPTFALLHEYAGRDGGIVLRHLDLYRLEDRPGELDVLGLPDSAAGAPVIVEWANRALNAVLPATIEVRLDRLEGESRKVRVRRLRPPSGGAAESAR